MLPDELKSLSPKSAAKPARLDAAQRAQIVEHLARVRLPVEVVASVDDSAASHELKAFLDDLATLCAKIRVRHDGDDARRPSFSIAAAGEAPRIVFAALPLGHELASLVLALVHAGGHPPRVEPGAIEAIRTIAGPLRFETYITLNCHNCPDTVQALNMMAILNPAIRHTTIDGMLFREEADRRKIVAVPAVFLDGEYFDQGRKTLDALIARLAPHAGSTGGAPARLEGG